MVSRGKVGLIVAGVGVTSGVLSTDIYTSIIRCYSIDVLMIHIDKKHRRKNTVQPFYN
jgi:hypothetical protein